MFMRSTREYLLKLPPASLVELLEGKDMRLRAAWRRMKLARRKLRPARSSSAVVNGACAILDLRRRKDLDW